MRAALRTLGWVALLLVAAVLSGALVPRPFAGREPASEARSQRVLVLSNPIHTDLALPLTPETRAAFRDLEAYGLPVGHPDARWLVVGWGGRAFYLETPTWSDLKPGPVLRALTLDRAVLRVAVGGGIDETDPAVTPLAVTDEALQRLTAFVLASFVRENGALQPLPSSGYGPESHFFDATGRFNALVGCNTWTASALRTAALRTGIWNPTPQSLRLSLALYN